MSFIPFTDRRYRTNTNLAQTSLGLVSQVYSVLLGLYFLISRFFEPGATKKKGLKGSLVIVLVADIA
tara:strand:- start:27 stop:227 length:201 start_codon:yes stop_codon:yes gene_type:complete